MNIQIKKQSNNMSSSEGFYRGFCRFSNNKFPTTTLGNDKVKIKGAVLRGFTLIELLVVVLIIGILAAVALPQYQQAVLRARFSNVWQVVQNLRKGAELYYLQNGQYKDNLLTELDIDYSKHCKGSASGLVCEGGFGIDMNDGNLIVTYAPGIKTEMTNAQISTVFHDTPEQERFRMRLWFAHSAYPNLTECLKSGSHTGNADLCQKMLSGFN